MSAFSRPTDASTGRATFQWFRDGERRRAFSSNRDVSTRIPANRAGRIGETRQSLHKSDAKGYTLLVQFSSFFASSSRPLAIKANPHGSNVVGDFASTTDCHPSALF
jgi:hypothetical protein